jgi:ParB-like chromosome segregation protein Spo0J
MQQLLFKPRTAVFERVRIDDILLSDVEPPLGKTRKSIALLGCFDPVTLRYISGDKPYELCDGQDRIGNLIAFGFEEVDAVVLPQETTDAEAALIGFLANVARRDNPIDEALKLKRVLDTGIAIDELAALIGVPKATLEQRGNLLELPAALIEAAKNGVMGASVALAITKLPQGEQTQLADILKQHGKLTANDVKTVRRVRKEENLAELEEALFSEHDFPSPLETFKRAVLTALSHGLEARELVEAIEEVGYVGS